MIDSWIKRADYASSPRFVGQRADSRSTRGLVRSTARPRDLSSRIPAWNAKKRVNPARQGFPLSEMVDDSTVCFAASTPARAVSRSHDPQTEPATKERRHHGKEKIERAVDRRVETCLLYRVAY